MQGLATSPMPFIPRWELSISSSHTHIHTHTHHHHLCLSSRPAGACLHFLPFCVTSCRTLLIGPSRAYFLWDQIPLPMGSRCRPHCGQLWRDNIYSPRLSVLFLLLFLHSFFSLLLVFFSLSHFFFSPCIKQTHIHTHKKN